ncbi:MAG: type II toxin-antitoxin system RelE/ParE family toxin [Pseudomonadota bacterium]
MRTIVWAEDGLNEYRRAIAYLAPRSPSAAQRLADAIDQTIRALADNPTGRPGRVSGTYEKVLRKFPYIIAYEINQMPDGEQIAILGIIHTSRDWPDEAWPE